MISANANVHISGKLLVLTVRKTDTDISGGIAWGLGEAGGRLAMRRGGESVCTTLGRELVCLTGSGCESMAIFFNRPHSSTSSFLLWIKLSHFLLWSWLINDKRHRITTFTNDKKFTIATLKIQKTEFFFLFHVHDWEFVHIVENFKRTFWLE